MPRKPTGKRSMTADGTVTVHGKAGNGEGFGVLAVDGRWPAVYRVPGKTPPGRSAHRQREVNAERAAEARRSWRTHRQTRRQCLAGRPSANWPTGGSTTCSAIRCAPQRGAKLRTVSAASSRPSARSRSASSGRTRRHVAVPPPSELAPKTVGHHRQTLAQVMDQAVELGLAVANPVRRVKAPRGPADNSSRTHRRWRSGAPAAPPQGTRPLSNPAHNRIVNRGR